MTKDSKTSSKKLKTTKRAKRGKYLATPVTATRAGSASEAPTEAQASILPTNTKAVPASNQPAGSVPADSNATLLSGQSSASNVAKTAPEIILSDEDGVTEVDIAADDSAGVEDAATVEDISNAIDTNTAEQPDEESPATPPSVGGLQSAAPVNQPVSPRDSQLLEKQLTAPSRSNRRIRGKRLLIIGGILLVVAGGLRWYSQAHLSGNVVAAQNKALVAEVAKYAVLPTGETPSITTIVDKEKVSQTFLASAADGDKVLLYFQAGKAVVYRPSTHQIVNIGPLTSPPAKIFLRDGTAAAIPSSLSDKLANPTAYTIVSQDSSPRQDYTHSLVVDIAGNRPDIAAKVAKAIGARVSVLPPGETAPAADILVIVGANTK